jgi:alcohol dehydrogenase class IV
MNFQYHLPVNIVFGLGRISEIGEHSKKYGSRALLVTGRSSTKKSGLLDRVSGYLSSSGVEIVLYDEVDQNPLTTTAFKGAAVAVTSGCDMVIGLGGGSILDAAKGIAFMAANSGDISDYIYARKTSDQALPLVLVPTTCGTGSEGNGFAVFTNPENKDKKSLRCSAIISKVSIIDPELMTTMPKTILASVGFDALCHNMEAYLSKIGQPMTDILSLEGIRLVGESLIRVYEDGGDMNAWEKLSWGSTLGGMVINTAGVTAAHGIEHPASGLRDIIHGRGLAALTPVVYEKSISGAPEKFAVISRLLGGHDQYDCVDRIVSLLERIGMRVNLGDQGINPDDVKWMAENCMKVSAAGIANNPVVFSRDDVESIYRKAM